MWQHLLYSLSGRRINLGDSKRARDRKELTAASPRRSAAARGSCPCSRARAASARPPSRRCSAWRSPMPAMTASSPSTRTPTAARSPTASPARAARRCATSCAPAREISGYNDISNIVARDETRLDMLASDTDPHVSEAFSDVDYREVAPARRPLLLDRADRHRHGHRALGDGRDARSRRPARGRRGPEHRRGAAGIRDAHLARGERLQRAGAQRRRGAEPGIAGRAARAARRAARRTSTPGCAMSCASRTTRTSPPAAPSRSATCSPRRAWPRATWPPRSSRGCARSPAAAWHS